MKISIETKAMRDNLLAQYITRAKGILHLGAHVGQEALKYHEFKKPVIWVEAIPSVCFELSKRIEAFQEQRVFSALLDRKDGLQRRFKISNNMEGVSSSIFDFDEYGNGENSLWPELHLNMISEIPLPTTSLDSLLQANSVNSSDYDLWILDLQGAELLALQGGERSLEKCSAILAEVSEVPVYLGGVLWDELKYWLGQKGFTPLWKPEIPHDDVLFVHERMFERVTEHFHSDHYLRHNSRRLEHLASLNLPLRDCSVLEVGAGIGDHTTFYTDRGCKVTVTDVRPENLAILRKRFGNHPNIEVSMLDMQSPDFEDERIFDVIHCYGLLYHLKDPEIAIRFMSQRCKLLCLETCISPDDSSEVNIIEEPSQIFSQSFYGTGCRPNQMWILHMLKKYFSFAEITETQPDHPEFVKNLGIVTNGLYRRVFIAKQE